MGKRGSLLGGPKKQKRSTLKNKGGSTEAKATMLGTGGEVQRKTRLRWEPAGGAKSMGKKERNNEGKPKITRLSGEKNVSLCKKMEELSKKKGPKDTMGKKVALRFPYGAVRLNKRGVWRQKGKNHLGGGV